MHASNDPSFARLSAINVNDHIDRKGNFAYLSWPYAVSELKQADPAATWEVKCFDGLPYLATDLGYFVEVAMTMNGHDHLPGTSGGGHFGGHSPVGLIFRPLNLMAGIDFSIPGGHPLKVGGK